MNATHQEIMRAHAVMFTEKYGFSVIPIGESKKPTIQWMEYQDRKPTFEEIMSWPIHNLALVTGQVSGIVVVDCDSIDDAKWFWQNVSETPTAVRSRKGMHYYFRAPDQKIANGARINGRYDVRGDGGYVLLPPSKHSEGEYSWRKPLVSVEDLPVFLPEWRPVASSGAEQKQIGEIRDAVRYIEKIKAVSGQRGHDDTYRAACKLAQSGLSETEAFCALLEWNKTNAEPPWSERELLHKIRSAFACSEQ